MVLPGMVCGAVVGANAATHAISESHTLKKSRANSHNVIKFAGLLYVIDCIIKQCKRLHLLKCTYLQRFV